MTLEMLKMEDARSIAGCTEEIIEHVCDGCKHANLDFKEPDFCPIQAEYGFDGEHPKIVGEKVGNKWRVLCLSYVTNVTNN